MNYIFNSQIVDTDGKPLVDGKIFVYKHNTSELAITYKDFEGHLNTNPIILDSLGHCNIIVDYGFYDLIIKNKENQLQFSILNLSYTDGGVSPETIEIVAGNNINVAKDNNVYTISLSSSIPNAISDLYNKTNNLEQSKQDNLTAGDHIDITDNTIKVKDDFQNKLTAGDHIDITDNTIKVKDDFYDKDYIDNNLYAINSTVLELAQNKQNKLTAGDHIQINTLTNTIKVKDDFYDKSTIDNKLLAKQNKLTAGNNITISDDIIWAADPYKPGTRYGHYVTNEGEFPIVNRWGLITNLGTIQDTNSVSYHIVHDSYVYGILNINALIAINLKSSSVSDFPVIFDIMEGNYTGTSIINNGIITWGQTEFLHSGWNYLSFHVTSLVKREDVSTVGNPIWLWMKPLTTHAWTSEDKAHVYSNITSWVPFR